MARMFKAPFLLVGGKIDEVEISSKCEENVSPDDNVIHKHQHENDKTKKIEHAVPNKGPPSQVQYLQ